MQIYNFTNTYLAKLSPKSAYWVKTLTKFISVQLAVQFIGVITGLLIVRVLTKEEFAYFTIANNINATLNILSNLGISAALLAIGSKVWQDRYRFGQLINTAIQLRYYLAAIAIILCLPPMLWLLVQNGASFGYTSLITILVLVGLNFQLSSVVLRTIPRLHSRLDELQLLDLWPTIIRFVVVCCAYLVYRNAAASVVGTVASAGAETYLLRRWFSKDIDTKAPTNEQDRKEIFNIVKNHAPESIFYTFQGQIQIWLIGIFGTTANIAEIGALSRLGILFSIISAVMTNIIIPSFSRYQATNILRRRYLQIAGFLAIISATLTAVGVILPDELLWILGSQYAYLHNEVYLVVLTSVLNTSTGILWQMNASRGWVDYAWVNIPATILLQISLITFENIATVRGVILFGFFSGIPWLVINILIAWHKLFQPSKP